jgi:hypothetical protein
MPSGLEFLVIGAQKAGTTTLWELLRHHPEVWLPETKEVPFFSHTADYTQGLDNSLYKVDAPLDCKRMRGTVTPHYMHGWHDTTTATTAARIANDLPDVKLIALLRDPVERARSQHAMAVARGLDTRTFDQAASDLLTRSALQQARFLPHDTNTYLVQGEYGRILSEYLRFFSRESLHVIPTDALADDPVAVVRRVSNFLGVSTRYRPPDAELRLFRGGRSPRVDESDVVSLVRDIDATPGGSRLTAMRRWATARRIDRSGEVELERIVRCYIEDPSPLPAQRRAALRFLLRKIWNVVPSAPEPVAYEVRRALEQHYAEDAEVLRAAARFDAPWRGGEHRPRRVAVYTAIAGGKDELAEPAVISPECDYICFTDNPYVRSETWQVRPLEAVEHDPARRARRAKLLTHRYLPEYRASVWVDGNITLRADPARFLRRHLGAQPLSLFRHPEGSRNVYEAGAKCIERAKDDPSVVERQMERYRAEGIPEDHLVASTAVLLRRHADSALRTFSEAWWEELRAGSRRDQLALTAVTWRRRRPFGRIDADVRDSELGRWEAHSADRRAAVIRSRIKRAETVLLSFPKAGRSWLRYFLAAYVANRTMQPLSLNLADGSELPPLEVTHDHIEVFQNAPARARLINEDLLKRRRVVVLVRDPRDSLVSYWHQKRDREQRPVPDRLDVFADCQVYGIERISRCTALLLDFHHRHPGESLLVRYEDVVDRPVSELTRVLRFVAGPNRVDENALRAALEQSSFAAMRKWERQLTREEAREQYGDRFGSRAREGEEDSHFKVRRGVVESHRSELPDALRHHVERLPHTRNLLERLASVRSDTSSVPRFESA